MKYPSVKFDAGDLQEEYILRDESGDPVLGYIDTGEDDSLPNHLTSVIPGMTVFSRYRSENSNIIFFGTPYRIGNYRIQFKRRVPGSPEPELCEVTVEVRAGTRAGMIEILVEGIPIRFEYSSIVSARDMLAKTVATTPIPTLPTDSTFGIESTTGNTMTFEFVRNNPLEIDNSSPNPSKWSNAYWVTRMSYLTNTWQTRVGGYGFRFYNYNHTLNYPEIGVDDGSPINVYISAQKFRFEPSKPTVVSGILMVTVGGLIHKRDLAGDRWSEYTPTDHMSLSYVSLEE